MKGKVKLIFIFFIIFLILNLIYNYICYLNRPNEKIPVNPLFPVKHIINSYYIEYKTIPKILVNNNDKFSIKMQKVMKCYMASTVKFNLRRIYKNIYIFNNNYIFLYYYEKNIKNIKNKQTLILLDVVNSKKYKRNIYINLFGNKNIMLKE